MRRARRPFARGPDSIARKRGTINFGACGRANDLTDTPSRLGVLVGATRLRDPTTGEERYSLDLLDLDRREAEVARIPLDFLGHGLAFHPTKPHLTAVFEKRGKRGCVADLTERQIVRAIKPLPGHAFYGHAAYSHTGDVLFVVESSLESCRGVVSIREPDTFATLGIFPTYGTAPHDCRLAEDGGTLVITNGGGPHNSAISPSVTFVDVHTHSLLEKHEVRDPVRNAGHVALGENHEFVLVSAPREGTPPHTTIGGVSLGARGAEWTRMDAPEAVASRLVGEALSVALHRPSRTALATHPDGNLVTLWNLQERDFVESFALPGPRGVAVTLDERFYVVSYGMEARLLFVDAQSRRPVTGADWRTGAFGGAHLSVWAR